MAKRRPVPATPKFSPDTEVPVVGAREPCPCGSGRRYKACHGREGRREDTAFVGRPFEGLVGEPDWVAMREIVPAATAKLTLAGDHAGRTATVATVLPMAWPALVRVDGEVFVGLQVQGGSGDVSRDVAASLERALASEPGTPVDSAPLPGAGPRLQELLDPSAPFEVTVHDGFDFWIEGVEHADAETRESLERANSAVIPTRRLQSVEAAYWAQVRDRDHLRWVLSEDEEPLLDALARLHARGGLSMGEASRYVGSFRALGLLVPVWDLPFDTDPELLEDPAAAFRKRLDEALAEKTPLSDAERHARSGLLTRQLTLR